MQILEVAAQKMGWSEWRLDRIRSMERVMEGTIFAESEGEVLPVTWFRMVHSSALGIASGRFASPYYGSMEKAESEARIRSLICALMDLPMSGAFGGLLLDSEEITTPSMIKSLAFHQKNWIGVERDLWLMGTSDIADALAMELEKSGDPICRAGILGKSTDQGGVEHRQKLAFSPITSMLKNHFRRELKDLSEVRCLIAAPPSLWPRLCKELQVLGMQILGVSDGFGGICSGEGLESHLLDSLAHQTPLRMGLSHPLDSGELRVYTQAEFFFQKADLILIWDIPFTLPDAAHIGADIVLPIGIDLSDACLDALQNKVLLPDLLALSGEAVFDFVEMQQNLASEIFSEKRIEKLLQRKVDDAMDKIYKVASETDSSLLLASWMSAMQELETHYPKIDLDEM